MDIRLIMVLLYLGVLLAIGAAASRKMGDLRDYFAAGKGLGYLAAAFSARATGESAWLLLGLTGMGAALGYKAFWVVLGEIIGVSLAWILLARRFKRLSDRYDAITMPDWLEGRFGDSSHLIRIVSAGSLVVFVTIYVAAQIFATGQAFNDFFGWNFYLGAVVGFLVVLVYIVAGGFLAVVWSDVFQGAMMVLGLVLLPIAGISAIGGVSEMNRRLGAIDPGLLTATAGADWNLATVASILSLALIGLGFLGSPQIFVRFIALKNEKEIRAGTLVAITWTLAADVGAVCTGLAGRALLTGPGDDLGVALGNAGESVLPRLAEATLPVVMVGLIIAVVMSAIMSTADSLLIVAGSAAVRDYYQQVKHPEMADDRLVGLSRIATFGLATLALVVGLTVAVLNEQQTVFWFVIFGWSGIAATFCPTVILSLFWRRLSRQGALAAMVTGFVGVPIFKFAAPQLPGDLGLFFAQLGELPPAFLASFLAAVVVSYATEAPESAAADLDFAAGDSG